MSDAGTTPQLAVDAGGRATITLARPRHLNRLHREDLVALQRHFAAVAADPAVRVLVITGAGRAFCAGFNLGELSESAQSAGDDPRLFEHTVDALETIVVPTIARINGGVYGGATDLALACDFRVGVAGIELRMPAARIGLHYYASGLRRAVARLGLGAAKRLFLRAEAVVADELLRIGYLDALVAADRLDAEVDALAAALAAGAPLAVRGMKASLDDIARGDAVESLLRDREAACAASADMREGLAAWSDRRDAVFVGR